MKIIAVNGSPRKRGNTDLLLDEMSRIIQRNQIETETIFLRDLELKPCDACKYCHQHTGKCHIKDDFPPIFQRSLAAEGIILGTPVYFGSATPPTKTFMDRVGYAALGMKRPFEKKIGTNNYHFSPIFQNSAIEVQNPAHKKVLKTSFF